MPFSVTLCTVDCECVISDLCDSITITIFFFRDARTVTSARSPAPGGAASYAVALTALSETRGLSAAERKAGIRRATELLFLGERALESERVVAPPSPLSGRAPMRQL